MSSQPLPQSIGWGAGQLQKGSSERLTARTAFRGRSTPCKQAIASARVPAAIDVKWEWEPATPGEDEVLAVSSPSKAIVSQAKRARKARYHEMMMQRAMDRWEAV